MRVGSATRARVLGLAVVLFSVAALSGCKKKYTLTVPRTQVQAPEILGRGVPGIRKVIFVHPPEASCPTACSQVIATPEAYNQVIAHAEKAVVQRGYQLISGAIVGRVGGRVMPGNWEPAQMALAVGKESGADAVFEIRSLYVDLAKETYLIERGDETFKKVPDRYAAKAVRDDRKRSMLFEVPYWEVHVEMRMIALDGSVVWSASKSIRTTDVVPDSWRARMKKQGTRAQINRKRKKRDQNYDYFMYFHDVDLQEKQVLFIIDELVKQLPQPY